MAEQSQRGRGGGLEVYWTTVRYRSLTLVLVALLLLAITVLYLVRPGIFTAVWAKLARSNDENKTATVQEAAQAHFLNLDGTVRVKRRNSSQWINADYRTRLEEGDMIQTTEQGMARITFVDGTTYVIKPDTLIVIEQNAAFENKSTRVAVQVSSGAVDLSTGTWDVPGSESLVRFANAEASMQENTRAAVKSDSQSQVHEITVDRGGAELAKQGRSIHVGPYERATFSKPDSPLTKVSVMAPPELLRPRNLEPIISTRPIEEIIQFEWSPVEQARRYRLRLSTSPLFTTTVIERYVQSNAFSARGLPAGEYYWTVAAVDEKNEESQESEANRFTLAEQEASEDILLVIDKIIQHGRTVEIQGRTEPGASVTVNAEAVAYVHPDGRFTHFTNPLPSAGAHTITVVAQNKRGEVASRKKTVLVQ